MRMFHAQDDCSIRVHQSLSNDTAKLQYFTYYAGIMPDGSGR